MIVKRADRVLVERARAAVASQDLDLADALYLIAARKGAEPQKEARAWFQKRHGFLDRSLGKIMLESGPFYEPSRLPRW